MKLRKVERKTAKIGPLAAITRVFKPIRTPVPKPRSSKLDLLRPKPPVPPTASARETGDWGIQVGAYSVYGAAFQKIQEAVEAMPNMPKSARAVVDRAFGDSHRLYRARLLGVSERLARDACRKLILKQFVCVPVPPKDGFVTIARN